ncbi:hypothetical protein Agabi119p4_9967 [Agaricus bisporus var. burnettii]|uniref:Tyr recombinase domain-containing protein n=1 Tax=Agaricus bisporus var. burnettii TaxID=192524 RepID=A0A8H7C4L4_AGABI|nr:hypothetical protein Agabi119p4_9967 [Agaricus bisporus var. burnettii]
MIDEALNNSIDRSTSQTYDSQLNSYIYFCNIHHLPTQPTPHNLARYVVYMAQFIKPSSIETYLSGITYRLQPYFPEAKIVRDNIFLKNVVKGVKRMKNSPVSRKQPITFSQLNNIASQLRDSPHIDDALFLSLLTTGFFALLRLGELTDPNDHRLQNRRKTIRRDSVISNSSSIQFILPASKTDKFFNGNQVMIHSNHSPNDPISSFHHYLKLRDAAFPNNIWLWLTSQGSPPTRRWFMSRFHLYFDARYGGHSLRAGGATLLASKGISFDIIQSLGRWSSEAFRIYIRQHPSILLQQLHPSPSSPP